jgi:hypothetical protein
MQKLQNTYLVYQPKMHTEFRVIQNWYLEKTQVCTYIRERRWLKISTVGRSIYLIYVKKQAMKNNSYFKRNVEAKLEAVKIFSCQTTFVAKNLKLYFQNLTRYSSYF